jgi:hypothetical protein
LTEVAVTVGTNLAVYEGRPEDVAAHFQMLAGGEQLLFCTSKTDY